MRPITGGKLVETKPAREAATKPRARAAARPPHQSATKPESTVGRPKDPSGLGPRKSIFQTITKPTAPAPPRYRPHVCTERKTAPPAARGRCRLAKTHDSVPAHPLTAARASWVVRLHAHDRPREGRYPHAQPVWSASRWHTSRGRPLLRAAPRRRSSAARVGLTLDAAPRVLERERHTVLAGAAAQRNRGGGRERRAAQQHSVV